MVYPDNQPNPSRFRIINIFSPNETTHLIEIVYPDTTNYEGRMILLYKDTILNAIVNFKEIDPHFNIIQNLVENEKIQFIDRYETKYEKLKQKYNRKCPA